MPKRSVCICAAAAGSTVFATCVIGAVVHVQLPGLQFPPQHPPAQHVPLQQLHAVVPFCSEYPSVNDKPELSAV